MSDSSENVPGVGDYEDAAGGWGALKAVALAAGGTLSDAVKVNVFLTDLAHFAKVNEIMATYFREPYPARVTVGVSSLPRGSQVEIDAVMHLG